VTLIKDRIFSCCGLINDKDGNKVIAIVGGIEKGMELWYPGTSEIQLLWNEIPPENDSPTGLRDAELITIDQGSEFLVYGGYNGNSSNGIWKYTVVNNTWEK